MAAAFTPRRPGSLASRREIADICAISSQRVHQLVNDRLTKEQRRDLRRLDRPDREPQALVASADLQDLVERGLVAESGDGFLITRKGRNRLHDPNPFPEPLDVLWGGEFGVWKRSDVEAWNARRLRRA